MRAERIERLALVLILLVVGVAAGAASFTHVHDWTMANSPAGTPGWFGWANAVISELVPIAALLTIRQRRRTGGTIGYPMFLLVSAVALSLAAQLAVAKPGPSGWLLSAVPALAFMGLSKLVLSGKVPPAKQATAGNPASQVTPVKLADVKPVVADVSEPVKRASPKVLTNAAKVEAAAAKLGKATAAEIAAEAGVSESTARRYMPRPAAVPSPSVRSPAETSTMNGRKTELTEVAA
ncbi:hypothetical protein EV384_6339 [Micromonospora kangleipakensis]|uniref:DUF2637 domain-containing protein n=1 Tax=Micromonospora kangleipakensis TaxID=1077942 RepID=A0A4Q8BIC9_9ACTN|nr:DUF2637 domain-containing protein [Micromonospora kangleipakensis]RZU77608.1 hypothetical protein EV384_6339 [Micromonospora kangleipakensis]